ncbi:ThuA domain-containing protein [Maribellus comscasis]|uniref:ThuA domain-containing protein n=1 Tax=Maribellus comscasis TaxID=2681766 RepID=A0A6I6JHS2_9BACT|nr:ThuA domain-containing protein [Maribellus comscasis]QGY42336.1 ThuA domain-containing protein [Maribellus comscasis]
MKKVLLLLFFSIFSFCVFSQAPVQIMLVTGGHSYDTLQFMEMFDNLEGVEYQHFEQPVANRTIANGLAEYFDVLVFYDMWQDITPAEKSAYIQLTKVGKPLLFLHHSLVSYQKWNEFEKIVGGKYIEKDPGVPESEYSTYDHDVWVYINPVGNHASTKGFQSFRFFDEVYGNTKVSDSVIPILTTKHPGSTETIGWENHYNSSKIVYLQPGHDHRTYEKKEYRELIKQTIVYLAGKNLTAK